MERIVVTWSRDHGYECGSELVTTCCQYESIEALYVHLEEWVKKWLQKQAQYHKEHEAYWKEARRLLTNAHNPAVKARQEKEWNEWVLQHKPPEVPQTEIILAGVKWDLSEFTIPEVVDGKRTGNRILDMPTIQMVDEWFDQKVLEDAG